LVFQVVSLYHITTLIYCFNESDDTLLMLRLREPNLGLWSPCGGKLDVVTGESPFICACREAREEIGLQLLPVDLHLTGIITETGFGGTAHWLMFLFEVKQKLRALPPPHAEGKFGFFARDELQQLAIPKTDQETLWPLFWKHRRGFFAAHYLSGQNSWTIEESRPVPVDPSKPATHA
jgi:8-oxo-dGTP diphosphatase